MDIRGRELIVAIFYLISAGISVETQEDFLNPVINKCSDSLEIDTLEL
ncbi:unnamed protein product, partial [Allacma fusca]